MVSVKPFTSYLISEVSTSITISQDSVSSDFLVAINTNGLWLT
jgi:hypothetical protein